MRIKATVVFPVAKQYLVDKLSVKNTVEFSVSLGFGGTYKSVQYIPDDEVNAFVRNMVVAEDLNVEFDTLPSYLRQLTEKQLMNQLDCDRTIEVERSNLIRVKTEYENC